MKTILLMMLLLSLTMPVLAKSCRDEKQQARPVRVRAIDDGYRLEIKLSGKWSGILTANEEISMPRFAMERAQVVFLLHVDSQWSLYLHGLNGESTQLGQLSAKPAQMCFDEQEQNLHLITAAGALTPLPLPENH